MLTIKSNPTVLNLPTIDMYGFFVNQNDFMTRKLKKTLGEYGIKLLPEKSNNQGSMSHIYYARKGRTKLVVKCILADLYYNPEDYETREEAKEHDCKGAFENEYNALVALKNSTFCVHLFNFKETGGEYDQWFEIVYNERYRVFGFIEPRYELFAENVTRDGAYYSSVVNSWCREYGADMVASRIGYCVTGAMLDMQRLARNSHRDIKTRNLLLLLNRKKDLMRSLFVLVDFGIAHIKQSEGDDDTLKIRVGSKRYRPVNDAVADWRYDQFMLGATLCEFYGVLTLSRDETPAIIPESEWGDEFRENKYGLRSVIFKMMAENAEDRYDDLQELHDTFKRIMDTIASTKKMSAGFIRTKPQSEEPAAQTAVVKEPTAGEYVNELFSSIRNGSIDSLPRTIHKVKRYLADNSNTLSFRYKGYLNRALGLLTYFNDDKVDSDTYFTTAADTFKDYTSRYFLMCKNGNTEMADFVGFYRTLNSLDHKDPKLFATVCSVLAGCGRRRCNEFAIHWDIISENRRHFSPLEIACSTDLD